MRRTRVGLSKHRSGPSSPRLSLAYRPSSLKSRSSSPPASIKPVSAQRVRGDCPSGRVSKTARAVKAPETPPGRSGCRKFQLPFANLPPIMTPMPASIARTRTRERSCAANKVSNSVNSFSRRGRSPPPHAHPYAYRAGSALRRRALCRRPLFRPPDRASWHR